MPGRLPALVYANDVEHLPVVIADLLSVSSEEQRHLIDLLLPLAARSRAPSPPPPVKGHLTLAALEQRALATIVMVGRRLTVQSKAALDAAHPLSRCELSPLREATAMETLELALRWFLGVGRLSRWRLAYDAELDDGVEGVAVVAPNFDDLEAFAHEHDCEGVAIVRGASALLEREYAPASEEARITVVPCRGGFPGPILAALWPRHSDE